MKRLLIIVGLLLSLAPSAAFAQQVSAVQAGGVVQALQAATQGWNAPLTAIANDLFGGLAVIGFVLSIGSVLLQGGGVIDILAAVLRMVIYLGFWLFILQGWPTFGHAIIASFQVAAQRAGSMPTSPADVMNLGTHIAMQIMNLASWLDPPAKIMLVFPASFAAVSFYVVAGLMLLSLAKAYMAIAMGTLLLGFAGNEFTLHIAKNVIWMTIAIGARLFAIEMLASLGATIIQAWSGQNTVLDQSGMWSVIGLGITYAIIVFSVPAMVEHMAGGGGHGHVGPGAMFRTMGAGFIMATGVGGGLARAGATMLGGLSSGGTGGNSGALPPPNGAAMPPASSGGAATPSMQPPSANWTP